VEIEIEGGDRARLYLFSLSPRGGRDALVVDMLLFARSGLHRAGRGGLHAVGAIDSERRGREIESERAFLWLYPLALEES
jgi:hypothetical protein